MPTTRRYAETTRVSAEITRGEIERTLARYGADQSLCARGGPYMMLEFRLGGRATRFALNFPTVVDPVIARTPRRRVRSESIQRRDQAQVERQGWRALLLVLKAKLEAIAAGVAAFDDEFFAYPVLADGRTVGELAAPQLTDIYRGATPQLLTGALSPEQ